MDSEKKKKVKNKKKFNRTKSHGPKFSSRFLSDYEPVQRLGQGGFGIVLEARDKLVGVNYAVKRIPISNSKKAREKVMREVTSHAPLNHHHIVRYYSTWLEAPPPGWQAEADAMIAKMTGSSITDPGWTDTYSEYLTREELSDEESSGGIQFEYLSGNMVSGKHEAFTTLCQEKLVSTKEEPKEYLYIVMELCCGTLKDWLDKNQLRTPKVITKLFRQICQGVEYIHMQGLIHRDLKPDNIYMSVKNGSIKIGDFGLATRIGKSGKGPQNVKHTDQLSHHVGTKLYMAPEMEQSGIKYNNKVDIFSLGLILVELLITFTTNAERCKVLDQVKRAEGELVGLDPGWLVLVQKMLHTNPDMRPDASNILRMCPKTPKNELSR